MLLGLIRRSDAKPILPLSPYFLIRKVGVVNNRIFKFSCSQISLSETADSASSLVFSVFLTTEPSLPIHSQCSNAFKDLLLSDLVLGSLIPTKGMVDNRNQHLVIILYFSAAGSQGLILSHFRPPNVIGRQTR